MLRCRQPAYMVGMYTYVYMHALLSVFSTALMKSQCIHTALLTACMQSRVFSRHVRVYVYLYICLSIRVTGMYLWYASKMLLTLIWERFV